MSKVRISHHALVQVVVFEVLLLLKMSGHIGCSWGWVWRDLRKVPRYWACHDMRQGYLNLERGGNDGKA